MFCKQILIEYPNKVKSFSKFNDMIKTIPNSPFDSVGNNIKNNTYLSFDGIKNKTTDALDQSMEIAINNLTHILNLTETKINNGETQRMDITVSLTVGVATVSITKYINKE